MNTQIVYDECVAKRISLIVQGLLLLGIVIWAVNYLALFRKGEVGDGQEDVPLSLMMF